MKYFFLLVLAVACSTKDPGDSEDTIVLDGQAYTLRLQPVMPPGQRALFDTVDVLQVEVTQADGSRTTHTLSGGDTGSSAADLPPLDAATLSVSGRKNNKIRFWGQTPPLTMSAGEHTQPITLAAVNTLASLEDLPVGLSFGAVAAGPDGRFFAFGGSDEGFIEQEAHPSVYLVDIGTPSDSLQPTDIGVDLPDISEDASGRMGHTANSMTQDTSLQGQILITGGTVSYVPQVGSTYTWAAESVSSDQAFLFDPTLESFKEVSSLSYPRYGHVAVENHKGEIVVIGGFNDQASAFTQPYVEVFDPEDEQFHQVGGILTTGTGFHAATRLGKQGVMSCGGVNYTGEPATKCAIIPASGEDATNMDWPGAPMLSPAMVTMADDRILLTGGLDLTDQSFELFAGELSALTEAWIFENGAWHAAGSMVHPRAWHTAVPLPDGRVLITGGVTRITDDGFGPANLYWGTAYDPGAAIACAEVFDPDTETFTEVETCLEGDLSASLPTQTLLAGAAQDPVHGVLIIGGMNLAGESVGSTLLYRPSPDL